MHYLDEVFKEAFKDPYASSLDTNNVEARLIFGVKIVRVREDGNVFIQNTLRGGNYYEEVSPDEYENFSKKGWRYGVYVVSLSNYRSKLDSINSKLHTLIVSKSSKSSIEEAKDSRTRVMKSYTKISKKLNLLK